MTSLCNITKEIFLSKNFMTNVAWTLVPGPFLFSKEGYMLIWTNISSFAIIYISSSLQNFEVILNSLQTKKDLELVFRSQFLQKFLLIFYDVIKFEHLKI